MENLAPLNIWTCSTRWHRYLASIIEKNVLKFLYVFLFYNFARNYLMWGQVIDHRSITLCVTTWMLVVEFRMSQNPFHPTLPSPIGIVRLLSYNNYSATAANGLWKFAMRLSSWPRKSMLILQNKIIKKMTLLFIFPFFWGSKFTLERQRSPSLVYDPSPRFGWCSHLSIMVSSSTFLISVFSNSLYLGRVCLAVK